MQAKCVGSTGEASHVGLAFTLTMCMLIKKMENLKPQCV